MVTVLAVGGVFFWAGSSEPHPEPPEQPAFPVVEVEMKADLDQFIAQFEQEPFLSLGLVEVDAFERELYLGWDRTWLTLPRLYRRDLVEKIGRPWAFYLDGVTRVHAVPDGREIARYSAEEGVALVGN